MIKRPFIKKIKHLRFLMDENNNIEYLEHMLKGYRIQSKNKFSAMSIQLDVPHQNRVGNNFYVFEHKYVDEMKNIQSVKAIGPNLVLNENGIGQLRNMGYNNDEIQKLIDSIEREHFFTGISFFNTQNLTPIELLIGNNTRVGEVRRLFSIPSLMIGGKNDGRPYLG